MLSFFNLALLQCIQNKVENKEAIMKPIRSFIFFLLIASGILFFILHNGSAAQMQPLEEDNATYIRPDTLIVGYDSKFPPFQMHQDGKLVGFNIELMQRIAELEGYQLEWREGTKEELILLLDAGEIDVALGITYSAQLLEKIEMSERYLSSSITLVRPKESEHIQSIIDLSELIVALQADTTEYEFLKNIRRLKPHFTSNQLDAFKLLELERADAFVGHRLTAEYLLRQKGIARDYIVVDQYVLPVEYTFGVRKHNEQLLQSLNRGLHLTKVDGSYNDIYRNWFWDEELYLREQLRTFIILFAVAAGLGLIIFFFGLRWNRQLQKQVDNKTKDLKLLNQMLEHQILETKNSQQLKEQILESSPRGIITLDQEGLISSINPRAVEILKLAKKPLGISYRTIPFVTLLLEDKEQEVLRHAKQYREECYLELNKPGVYIRYNVYPLYDFQKQIVGTILTFEDITKEYQLRQQLFEQEKSKALNQMIAGIAHEIRNPLTSIKTFVELIPYKLMNQRFQQELTTHVPKEMDRLNHLIDSLMDFSKAKKLEKARVNLSEIIKSAIILFERSIKNKGFRLEVSLEENLYVYADPNRCKQILINLIINAIEAIEMKLEENRTESGNERITLTCWSTGDYVFFSVKDEGVGMTSEEIKRAIDPFYTTKPKGTGLGLALTKQFIEENNGALNITSEKGKGTTIEVRFRKDDDHG